MYGPQEQTLGAEVMAKRQAAMDYEGRNNSIMGAEKLRQRPAMESLMEQMIQNLCMLEDTVAMLDGRTQPIRNQVPQVEKTTSMPGVPSGSPIGSSLAHQTMRIQNLNTRIQSIISELEI